MAQGVNITDRFIDGDVVMVCKHIYEKSTCRVVQKQDVLRAELRRGGSVSDRFTPPLVFSREDGSGGLLSFTVKCASCVRLQESEIDYIEQHWRDGALRVADFAKAGR